MSERPTITAALITLNEQHELPGLLSQLDWVDEVVVVDSGSVDQTVAVARESGCRVAVRRFDDYATQRNYALQMARGDWILSMDADERPTRRLVTEIRRCLSDPSFDAFRVRIRSRIFGRRFRFSGTQDDCPVRLFRRGTAAWRGGVHERLCVRGPVGQLRGWLEHETLGDLAEFLQKMNHYTAIEVRDRAGRAEAPRRHEIWTAPLLEIGRRLIWKLGLLDGPQGWAFGLLSGLSAWVTAVRHRKSWDESQRWLDHRSVAETASWAAVKRHAGAFPRRASTDRLDFADERNSRLPSCAAPALPIHAAAP